LKQYRYIFSIEKSKILSLYKRTNHTIDFLFNVIPFYRSIYPLSSKEFQMLRKYLDNFLKKQQIKSFKNLIEASILFIPKKDNSLHLYINYRRFNSIIIKNRYLLLFISKILNWIVRIQFFIKIDIKDVYHYIWIKENDK